MKTKTVVKKPSSIPDVLPVRKPGGYVYRAFVLYGRSGTGKTTIASTFPKPILHADVKDAGDDSISDIDLDVLDIKNWDDFEVMYWWLKKNPKKYKTLVVDTMSQLQQLAIKKVVSEKRKSESKAERAGDWGTMTKRDWGEVAALMKAWIINLRDLPMNVVFIAQDRVFNIDNDGEDESGALDPEVGPGLSPSIAKHLNAAVHFIANTFVRQRTVKVKLKGPIERGKPKHKEVTRIEFCVRIGPNPTYITKVRKPKAFVPPSVIVDPTYEKLINLMHGKE